MGSHCRNTTIHKRLPHPPNHVPSGTLGCCRITAAANDWLHKSRMPLVYGCPPKPVKCGCFGHRMGRNNCCLQFDTSVMQTTNASHKVSGNGAGCCPETICAQGSLMCQAHTPWLLVGHKPPGRHGMAMISTRMVCARPHVRRLNA